MIWWATAGDPNFRIPLILDWLPAMRVPKCRDFATYSWQMGGNLSICCHNTYSDEPLARTPQSISPGEKFPKAYSYLLRHLTLALFSFLLAMSPADARTPHHHVPYFLSASHPTLHSIVRITWRTCRIKPSFTIDAYDDSGAFGGTLEIPWREGPSGCGEIVELNSYDLENGNPEEGWDGVGQGVGDWQLFITTPHPDIVVTSYVSTQDGFLVAMHDTVPFNEDTNGNFITTFNFADASHEGLLRIINPNDRSIYVSVQAQHDRQVGNYDGGAWIPLMPHEVITVTDENLETYNRAWHRPTPEPYVDDEGPLVEGGGVLGEYEMEYVGRWRLYIQGWIVDEIGFKSDSVPLVVMHLMEDAGTGIIANLSSVPDLKTASVRGESAAGPGCTDESNQALAHTTGNGRHNTSVPAMWDGTPFVVDISSGLPDAQGLLYAIAEEAVKISDVLGYELIVPGEVLPLAVLTRSHLTATHSGSRLIPPDQHIEIRCCDRKGWGVAYPWWRMILLMPESPGRELEGAGISPPRYNLIHELWHLFGFVHPGDRPGVTMSDNLNWGAESFYPSSTSSDLEKLACIFGN